MKKLIIVCAAMAAIALADGCKSITVDNRGQRPLLNVDGSVVLDQNGRPFFYSLGWETKYFQHWNWQRFDAFGASIRTNGTIDVTINGYSSGADSNLVSLVSTSLEGVAKITEKVAAAIVTYGGTVAADFGTQIIQQAAERFVSKGGDVATATVTCDGTDCKICDANGVCETCTDCIRPAEQ